jgi:hypothetical protein
MEDTDMPAVFSGSSGLPDFRLPQTNTTNYNNGRVNFDSPTSAGGFLADPAKGGFGYRTQVDKDAGENLLRGNWSQNTLSKSFFSPENISALQNTIRHGVFKSSGDKKWLIDEQSVDELQIVMRSIYLQYAKNLETNIPKQIQDLNILVIDWCVPHILSELSMYHYYLDDISHLPVPLSHPVTMTSAGTKSMPFRKFM